MPKYEVTVRYTSETTAVSDDRGLGDIFGDLVAGYPYTIIGNMIVRSDAILDVREVAA